MRATVLAASVVLCGCSPTGPDPVLDVWMTLADSVVSSEADVDVELRVTNRGPREVGIAAQLCPQYRLIDERGVAWPSSIGCVLGAQAIELGVGESAVFSSRWSARTSSLARGRFGLQSRVWPLGRDPGVDSNVVPIRIEAAP